MGSERYDTVTFSEPADAVFTAALGSMQNMKTVTILAVHNGGRRIIVRDRAKMLSNAKIVEVLVEDEAGATKLTVAVIVDPRVPTALMDGKFNEKALKKHFDSIRGALDGSSPAPASPVTDHFMQKKTEVPWVDPQQDPAIEAGGNFRAMYGL